MKHLNDQHRKVGHVQLFIRNANRGVKKWLKN